MTNETEVTHKIADTRNSDAPALCGASFDGNVSGSADSGRVTCEACKALDPAADDKEFYFRVFDDGDAMVMVIDRNGNYSQHLSTDETEGDGDGAFGPYHWNDAQSWSKTTREHAETMLKFEFTDKAE